MKASTESQVSYRVEVECLDRDPLMGSPLPPDTATRHTHRLLAELPFLYRVDQRIKQELELTAVKIWKKAPDDHWMLLCQYTFDEEAIAKRVAQRQDKLKKLTSWREAAAPGDRASLGEILGDTPL